jgi:YspA, cpYpsA-related SLOG family
MTAVLVCGGRDFDNGVWLRTALTQLHTEEPFSFVIEGGAPGADTLAREWAESLSIQVKTFKADWMAHGRAAGPLRNRRMIEEGKPDMVVAFPGGRGTANMVNQARASGVRTLVLMPSAYSHAMRTAR